MATLTQEHRDVEHAVVSGSSTEAVAGAAALVLAILGLAQISPRLMIAISSIALGAALILDGATIAAEYSRILASSGNGAIKNVELGGGLSTQIGGGVAAVVLGVLALLNLDATTLMAIATIVLGSTLVFSSGVSTRLNALKIEGSGDHDLAKRVAREALTAAIGTEVLVGLGAAVLGILALVGIDPTTLILVAMLALGASILLTGSAVVGRMMSIFSA
ncbi:MAG: hypothetical protein P8X48_08075 [Acidiferrobacteraceae bacterium]|jgi:hypothetical protein